MSTCTFCNIIADKAPSEKIYHDDLVTAFKDIHPVAPIHILIVPNKHIDSMNEVSTQDEGLIGHMFVIARQIAEQKGISSSGFRLIINTGKDGGQVIYHLHLHLIGGRPMRYPMG
jgi:histidine triad (HIT) family protein